MRTSANCVRISEKKNPRFVIVNTRIYVNVVLKIPVLFSPRCSTQSSHNHPSIPCLYRVIHPHTWVHTYTHAKVHTHTQIHTHMYIYTHTYTHRVMQTRRHARIHIHIYTYTHIETHTQTYIDRHTHKPKFAYKNIHARM